MEYVSKINIFGLKMMVKSGLENYFLKFLHAQNYFFYLKKMPKIANSVIRIINETLSCKSHPYPILSMYESVAY